MDLFETTFLQESCWLQFFAVIGVIAALIGTVVIVLYAFETFSRCRRARFQLRDRSVLVTGAAGGIGRALAIELARQGCHLCLWDIRENALKDTANMCRSIRHSRGNPVFCHIRALDVSDATAVDEAFLDLRAQFCSDKGRPPISVLINNCGIVFGKSISQLSAKEMQRTLAVNSFAPMYIIKKGLAVLGASNEGSIVNVSSMMSRLCAAGLADYCCSKWGLNGMHECLRQEIASSGLNIDTLLVCPYIVSTGMFKGALDEKSVHWWHSWLFPTLRATDVAEKIVTAIKERKDILNIPRVLSLVPTLLHLLPTPVYDFVIRTTGGQHGLSNFEGRGEQWNFGRSS